MYLKKDRGQNSQHKHLPIRTSVLVVIVILCFAGFGGIFGSLFIATQDFEEKTAIQTAARYTDALKEFRTLYTSEVVARVRGSEIEVTHDYLLREKAIPLPATLSMELGRRLGGFGSRVNIRLYSAYPFPWRKDGGVKDDFEREALEQLKKEPSQPYFQFETSNGQSVLRYATADLMRPACVGCHNSHPDTPKNDWNVGDVRGVLEVTIPTGSVTVGKLEGLSEAFGIAMTLTVLGLILIGLVIARQRQDAILVARQANELRQVRDGLEVRVEERTRELKQSEERILEAKNEAEAANQAKSQFLSSMSHELNTPMNAILGFGELLSSNVSEPLSENQKNSVDYILAGGHNLQILVENILLFTEITDHKIETILEAENVNELVEANIKYFKVEAELLGINLISEFPKEELPMISIDPGYGSEIIKAFLSNAIRFSKEEGEIIVSTMLVGNDRVRITIKDTGKGIAKEYWGEVFLPFHRLDMEDSSVSGAGVGLSIAKTLAELMGGSVGFESEEKVGSAFWVEFKVAESTKILE